MNRKKILIILGVLIGICLVIGGSYAAWILTVSQTGQNKILASCLNLTLTKEENIINLQNAYPIYDEEGKTLTPYSFTIENTCDIFASYIVQLEMTETSTLPTQYIRAMVNNEQILNLNEYEETKEYVNKDTTEARILTRGALGEGDSEDYTLRLWIDSDVDQFTTDAIGKTLSAKITITAAPSTYSPVENGITTLHDAILANEYQTSNIEIAKEKIAQKQQPDFSKTAPIIDWQENHATETNTIRADMPDPADVGSGKDYAANLTNENVYPAMGTSYTFNSETGKYTLNNVKHVDPTTLDYSNNDYYYCGINIAIDNAGIMTPEHPIQNCAEIYKILSSSKENSNIHVDNDTSYPAIRYTYTVYRYTQKELESDKSDKGLYAAPDDYGTSYYYRGSVNNNYVSFAGYSWRIIRINGDGSIRLIFNKNPEGNLSIGTSSYNSQENKPLYVGYMYGNPEGTTLEETNKNLNDSTIKLFIDKWYLENLNNYSDYIADSGFCNDRNIYEGDGLSSSIKTRYNGDIRYTQTITPTFSCQNYTDFFTVSNKKGNQNLSYPIGMITIDEIMYAGSKHNTINRLYYLYNGQAYWTMTPMAFSSIYNSIFPHTMSPEGIARGYATGSTTSINVRPVINLKADVEITGGIGTQNEPFVVKTA